MILPLIKFYKKTQIISYKEKKNSLNYLNITCRGNSIFIIETDKRYN